MSTLADNGGMPPVAAGVVEVKPGRAGWYSVAIGRDNARGGWTKRFWLSDSEARQLIDRLTEVLPS